MLLDGNCCWTVIADSLFQIELPNGTEKPAHFATQLARLLVVAMTTIVASMAAHNVDNVPVRLMIALVQLLQKLETSGLRLLEVHLCKTNLKNKRSNELIRRWN